MTALPRGHMSKQRVTFRANEVCIGEESWKLPFPILDLRLVGNNVAIIYDYMAGPRHRQFQNLECFDPDGVKLWTAHHPTNATNDAYVQFVDGEPLAV